MYRVLLLLCCIFSLLQNNAFAVKADSWYEDEAKREQEYKQQQQQNNNGDVYKFLYEEPIIKLLSEINLGKGYWEVEDTYAKYRNELNKNNLILHYDENAKLRAIEANFNNLSFALAAANNLKNPNRNSNYNNVYKQEYCRINLESFVEAIEKFTGSPKGSFKLIKSTIETNINNNYTPSRNNTFVYEGNNAFIGFRCSTTNDNEVCSFDRLTISRKLPKVGPNLKGIQLGDMAENIKDETIKRYYLGFDDLITSYNGFQITEIRLNTPTIESMFQVKLDTKEERLLFINQFKQHYKINGPKPNKDTHGFMWGATDSSDCGDFLINFSNDDINNRLIITLFHKGVREMKQKPPRTNAPNFD